MDRLIEVNQTIGNPKDEEIEQQRINDCQRQNSFLSSQHLGKGLSRNATRVDKLKTRRLNTLAELIAPAVNGTLNVLRSCMKFSSVKRVVVTSSLVTVSSNGLELPPDAVVDETWFSSSEFYQENKEWYHLSKNLAEEAAWKFSREHGMDMVVLNPGLVIGPLLQPTLNASSSILLSLINGSRKFLSATLRVVNVKDVAKAHILAYEVPSASGRYCLVERSIRNTQAVEIIRKLYPSYPLPEKCANQNSSEATHEVSKVKARSLGLDFIPFEQSIKEAIESLKEKGFLTM